MKSVFKDPEKLQELLRLRMEGWSTRALAEHFGTYDHHAILYQCAKAGLPKRISLTVYFYQPNSISLAILMDVSGIVATQLNKEFVNPGKTYAEYVREQKNRYGKRENEIRAWRALRQVEKQTSEETRCY